MYLKQLAKPIIGSPVGNRALICKAASMKNSCTFFRKYWTSVTLCKYSGVVSRCVILAPIYILVRGKQFACEVGFTSLRGVGRQCSSSKYRKIGLREGDLLINNVVLKF